MPNLFKIKQYNLNPGTRRTFRSGSRYHIIFVLRGICQFLETGYSSCCPSDIIFLKPGQTREILASSQKTACRLLCLAVSEESLAALSDATCNLAENFRFAPYDTAVIPGEMRSSVLLRKTRRLNWERNCMKKACLPLFWRCFCVPVSRATRCTSSIRRKC